MNTTGHTDAPQYNRSRSALLTVNGAAAALAISRGTVYKLVREDRLASVRVGERLRFRPEAIDAYLDRKREAGP